MIGIFPGISFFLLQNERVKYFKDDNPEEVRIVLIGIGIVLGIVILFKFIRSGMSSSIAGGKGRTQVTPRKFNAFTLYRLATVYGLEREQTKVLEYVFRIEGVTDPERVMSNLPLLDRHFKRAFRAIEKNSETDNDAQERLMKLFALRNTIEAGVGSGDSSAPHLSENTPAVLIIDKDNYPVKVISARNQNVIIEIPRNSLGTPVRIAKGLKVTLSFFTKSNKGFSLDGHADGSLDTDHGPGLQINHTGKLKPLVKRMYLRKQTSLKGEFYLVHLDESGGKKKPPKLIVTTKKFLGTILDISAGGCALKTTAPVQVGSRLKITVDYSDHPINVLGQVLRINRSGAVGTILHVKFLKVPRRAFNTISALVFGYDDD